MANRWGKMETETTFLGLQNHCGLWLQPWNQNMLVPWKETYDKPRRHIKKQRHYFACKALNSQSMDSPVVMYECESWTIKKAKHWRTDAFELWCWRRLLRVPWTSRRSNQSIPKKISPGFSLERLMLKLKLQYFGHLMWRTDSFERTLMLGKIEGGRRRGKQKMRWLEASQTQWTWVWLNSNSCWWIGRPGMLQSMGSQRVRHDWMTELNWTLICGIFLKVELRSQEWNNSYQNLRVEGGEMLVQVCKITIM